MTPEAAAQAAGLLLAARRDCRPLARLPDDCRPASLAEGYAIQEAVVAQCGTPAVGFKIGATSEKAQRFLDIDTPFSGCILAAGLQDSPASLSAGRFNFCLIEPEFSFRMASPLAPRGQSYDEAAVAAAVGSLHPAVEVVSSAYGAAWSKAGGPALVADNGVHGAFVLGPACSDWRALDLGHHRVTLSHNGRQAGEGVGGNALGGPLTALTWLVNQQRALGRALDAGQLVTTGVVTDFIIAAAGDEIVADYGELGRVELRLTP
ncbi:MAG: 2-keto-4-pentenoate hydratase [Kiloniellales bacterium]